MTRIPSSRWTPALVATFLALASTASWAAVTYDNLDKWIDKHTLCFGCHDSKEGMKKWLLDHEEDAKTLSSLAPLIHSQHQQAGRSLGNCLMCHGDGPQAHWKVDLDKNNCKVCHDIENSATHVKFDKREDCLGCHTAKAVGDAHTARFKAELAENQRALVGVTFDNARWIQDGKDWYADLTLRLTEKDGKTLRLVDSLDNTKWVEDFKLYVNFEGLDGYAEGRAVAATKSTTAEKTPEGGLRYRVGPFDLTAPQAAAGNGKAVVSLTYCFDKKTELTACRPDVRRNAAWNTKSFFTSEGPAGLQGAAIVSNQACGNCHGYVAKADTTQIQCGGCHNEKTAAAKAAGTKHFSGTDGTPVTQKRTHGLPLYTMYTSDLTDLTSCSLCHNAKTVPTATIRNRLANANDPHFADELLLSHPDMKVFAHALHSNNRPGQLPADSIRHVTLVAHTNNCAKCHNGSSYSLDRLNNVAKTGTLPAPLAMDTQYDASSKAHPATDVKADRFASPMAATCYACHAKKDDGKGGFVWNDKAKQHILDMGGVLSGKKTDIRAENCASCHTSDNLKSVHGVGAIR